MKIIIAGAGDVGFHLARLLSAEEHDLTIIDLDQNKLNYVSNHLDVAVVRGDSSSYKVLRESAVFNADLLIAATSTEENNLLTGMIAKKLGAKRTVARISNNEFLNYRKELNLKELGIDEIISPETLAAREIKRLLRASAITDSFDFEGGHLSLIGLHVEEKNPLEGKNLAEMRHLNPKHDFITVAILRDGETIIPRGDTVFMENDHVYYIIRPEAIDDLLSLFGKKNQSIRNVMILGGSKVGINAARKLSRNYKVKLIEEDRAKCFDLVDQLPRTMIINGDGRDVELLEEEGISNMDAFIALTGNSETNIITSLVAKNHGVGKTISLIENIDYIHLSQNIGVDTMINKKLIAANFTFRYIRQGHVMSVAGLHGVEAEILEFRVPNSCRVTSKKIKNLDIPRSAIIGGVIRKGKGYVPMGEFQLREGDRVVVLSRPECVHKIEEFFVDRKPAKASL